MSFGNQYRSIMSDKVPSRRLSLSKSNDSSTTGSD